MLQIINFVKSKKKNYKNHHTIPFFMTKFKTWMKKNNLKVADVVDNTSLNEKTITKLRNINAVDNFQIQTFIKLKKGYPNIKLKHLFPEINNLC